MPLKQIETKQELLDFAIERYKYYANMRTQGWVTSGDRALINQILADFLVIQQFSSKKDPKLPCCEDYEYDEGNV